MIGTDNVRIRMKMWMGFGGRAGVDVFECTQSYSLNEDIHEPFVIRLIVHVNVLPFMT